MLKGWTIRVRISRPVISPYMALLQAVAPLLWRRQNEAAGRGCREPSYNGLSVAWALSADSPVAGSVKRSDGWAGSGELRVSKRVSPAPRHGTRGGQHVRRKQRYR